MERDLNSRSPEDAERSDAEAQLTDAARQLADGIDEALGPWVVWCVERIAGAWFGATPPEVLDAAREAAGAASAEVVPKVRELLTTDVDAQWTNPLALLRGAVRYPTSVLRDAGVPPVQRDEGAETQFPDDDYDLVPARFADLAPELHELGLVWGAAKAHVHLRRRRAEGKR